MPALASEFIFDEKLLYYLKLYILMYADDTVVLAESEDEMQKLLNTLHEYCEEWKLKINVTKTKIAIVIFLFAGICVMLCKAKRQYLLTCKVSRYSILAMYSIKCVRI